MIFKLDFLRVAMCLCCLMENGYNFTNKQQQTNIQRISQMNHITYTFSKNIKLRE